jgi:hypothetical protein
MDSPPGKRYCDYTCNRVGKSIPGRKAIFPEKRKLKVENRLPLWYDTVVSIWVRYAKKYNVGCGFYPFCADRTADHFI